MRMSNNRIFIFVSTEDDRYLVKGGIATYLGTLLPEAASANPDDLFIWVSQSPNNQSFVELQGSNIERYYLSRELSGRKLPIGEYAPLIEFFLQSKISELHAKFPSALIFLESPDWEGLCAELFTTTHDSWLLKVTRCHGPMANCFKDNLVVETESNLIQHRREQKQLLASDLISCPSHFIFERIKNVVLAGIELEVPHVIYGNCIEERAFRPNLASKENALQLLSDRYGVNIPSYAETVFSVGSLEPRKGTFTISHALNKVLSERPTLHFCFIGLYKVEDHSDPLASESIKLSREQVLENIDPQLQARVHFAGVVAHHELPVVVHGADIHIICYLADNFPGALSEVALSQLPLIAALRGGIPDMITDESGKVLAYGLSSDKDTDLPAEISEAIKSFYASPSVGIQKAAQLREFAVRCFSPSVIVGKYYRYYEERIKVLCKNRGR